MAKKPAPPAERVERRRLLFATVAAILIALLVLLVAVLPAEYGIDPTGIGGLVGFSKLSETAANTTTSSNTTSLYTYRITWSTTNETMPTQTGYTREGATSQPTFELARPNITRVTAHLAWVDANETAGQRTRPDLFELQVLGPEDRAGVPDLGRNAADGKGNVSASLDWRAPPPSQALQAATDEEAAAETARLVPEDRSGIGRWRVRVALLDAGDVDAQGVPTFGPAADEGNTWTLRLDIESYFFDPASLNASKERQDVARIELAAGQGIEYKFDLEESAPLEYTWNTTGPAVYFDFHGEPRGDTTGAFTSHKTGTAARDRGELTAPFAGTHGWYWENRGEAPVTVELVTSGVYTIIGRK